MLDAATQRMQEGQEPYHGVISFETGLRCWSWSGNFLWDGPVRVFLWLIEQYATLSQPKDVHHSLLLPSRAAQSSSLGLRALPDPYCQWHF